MNISSTEFYPNQTKMWKIGQNFIYVLKQSMDLIAPIFHETHNLSMTLCENLMYRISPKSLKKYGQYR
jgi:hypothetical protein